MASITAITLQSPPHALALEEIPEFTRLWFPADQARQAQFKKLCDASGVVNRHFAVPYKDAVHLGGLSERASVYRELGADLLRRCLASIVEKDPEIPHRTSLSIFTSCSVPTLPALDSVVLPQLGFSPNTLRLPIFQHGCVAGVVGISLGSRLADAGEVVLLSSLELCSLVFQPSDSTTGHLVGAAIFADGSGAMTIEARPGLARIRATHSTLVPGTEHLIGYRLLDDGLHLVLDKDLPDSLWRHLPTSVNNFLRKEHLTTSDISYWLIHPGGKKILDGCCSMFEFDAQKARWSYKVLREFGNISSAGIFFVLNEFFNTTKLARGEKALVLGMGPGLTLELVLLEGE